MRTILEFQGMKRILTLIGIVLLCSFIYSPIFAQENKTQEPSADIPDWLKRTEFSAQWETDKKPTFYLQTVQPLYQDNLKENTIFIQPRLSLRDERLTSNLGLGYRRLTSENLLLGANLFFDYQDLHRHARAGFGLEALGQIFEGRFNTYFAGITQKRLVQDTGATQTYERVVNGMDLEIGASVPYLPWLKIYGSGFWYDFKTFKDKVGWKSRAEAKLNDYLSLEFYTWDDNKGDQQYGGRVRVNIAFNGLFDFRDALKPSKEPFPKKDLTESTLIPVERSYDITVEKWTKSATTTIEVYRGN